MTINRFSINKSPMPRFLTLAGGTVGFLQLPTRAGIMNAYLLSDVLKVTGVSAEDVQRITARRERKATEFRRIRYFPVAYMNTFIGTGGTQYGYDDENEVAIIREAFSQFIQQVKE